MYDKYAHMGRGQSSEEEFFLNFGTLPKFGTGEARHFKFDKQIDHSKCKPVDK